MKAPKPLIRVAGWIAWVLLVLLVRGIDARDDGRSGVAKPAGIWGVVLSGGMPVPGTSVLLYRGVANAGSMAAADHVQHNLALLDRLESTAAPVASSRTDAHGAFVFPALEPGIYAIEGRGPAGIGGLTSVVRAEVGRFVGVPLLLGRAVAVEGSVIRGDGAPFRGSVVVGAAHGGPGEEPWIPPLAVRHVVADRNGRFRLEGLPVGCWRVFAGGPGSGWEVVSVVEIDPTPTGDDAVEIVGRLPLRSERVLRVVDEAGGGVPGARVVLTSEGWMSGGVTSADGRVGLPADSGSAHSAFVAATGFRPLWSGVEADATESVIVLEGSTRPGRVSGRVTAPDGVPVSGVEVRVMSGDSGYLVPRSAVRRTGADGSFVFDDVEPGPAWLRALGAGVACRRLSGAGGPPLGEDLFQVRHGGETRVEVRALRGRSLVGRVVDERGEPVAGALLRWEVGPLDFAAHGIEDAPPEEQVVRSGPDGVFRIPTVASRVPLEVVASAPGFVGAPVTVRSGADGAESRAVLIPVSPARWLTLDVRRGGAAAVGATVTVTCHDEHVWGEYVHEVVVVGRSGSVVAGPFPRRDLQVEVSDSESPQPVQVGVAAADDRPVSLSLEPGLEITGRLTDASGEPAAGVTVYAERRVRRGKRSAMADQDGRFRIAGLASGEWLLTARAGAAEAERVASAGSHEVLLVLRGDSSVPAAVQIRVVGHDGGEVTQAALGWKSPTQSGSGLWAPGKEIELYGDDGAAGLEIEVVNPRDAAGLPLPYGPGRAGPLERRDREIEVTLPAGLSATGRVSVPAGGDAGGLSVVAAAPSTLTDAPIVIGEATTRPDGTFDVPTGGDADVALAVRANSGARVGLVSPVGARPGGEPVVLPLVRRADVTLTVLTTEGRPADGVLVTVVRRVLTDEPEEHRARADEQGVAVLGALVPGAAYALQIQGEDPGSAALALDPWLAEDGTLRLEARLHVTGLVRDDVGAPYPRAFILLRVDGQWAGFSIADDAGRFAMEVGSDARLDVLALPPFDPWNNGFCEWELGSKPAPARAGDPVSLVVSRGASVEYRLDARRPESWAGAHMVLTRVDGKTSPEVPHGGRVPLSPSGRGRLPPLVGGARYTLFLPEGESGHCALLSFVATEGGLARLVHAEAGAVTGRVRGAPEGIPIRVRAPFQEQAAAARVAADGSFAVGGLPIGIRVELEATAGGDGQSWVGSVVAEPGDDVLMDLVSAGIPGVGPR